MPGRNIVKRYAEDSFYHIYSRGVAKQTVFFDEHDYTFFLSLLKRYLSSKPSVSSARVVYPWYGQRVDLLAFCLMPNHIHLLMFQRDQRAIVEVMRSVMTSYSLYFNRRYKRVGPVFQSRYRASLIDHDSYLQHISRYIHLNPKSWRTHPYSSLDYYRGTRLAEWVKPELIMNTFGSTRKYIVFLEDYEDYKSMMEELKWELAHK